MYCLVAIFSFCVISPDCIFIVHAIKINVCSHNHCSALLLKIWVVAWRIFFWDELFAFCAAANTFCIFSKVTGACSLFPSSGAVLDDCSALKGPVCIFVDRLCLEIENDIPRYGFKVFNNLRILMAVLNLLSIKIHVGTLTWVYLTSILIQQRPKAFWSEAFFIHHYPEEGNISCTC